MNHFDNNNIKLDILEKEVYSLRWAEVTDRTIPLTTADMGYPYAPAIKQALLTYVEEGYFSYTLKLGLPVFDQAFSNYAKETKGGEIKAEQVLTVDNTARAMFVAAKAFLRPGDEAIVFDPYDFLFRESCLTARATPISYAAKLGTENRKVDPSRPEGCISERARMIRLCNLHNPYGPIYMEEESGVVVRLCEKHDLLIMNDEMWSDILHPDVQLNSTYCLGGERCKRVVPVFGFSKSLGLAGLRIGCVCASDDEKPQKLVDASDMLSIADGATSLSQVTAIVAMEET